MGAARSTLFRPAAYRSALRFGSLLTALVAVVGIGVGAAPAQAATFAPISGAGSTAPENALDQWIRDVSAFNLHVNYVGTGSTDGRNQFANGTVDFAMTEVPYGRRDGGVVVQPPARAFGYLPLVGGGTSFMYNLRLGTTRITSLRLSAPVLAGIFTGTITDWSDAAIAADNPGLTLPDLPITPVVRSDGSGTTWNFTQWLSQETPDAWDAYCAKAGRGTRCGPTSFYPVVPGGDAITQSGSIGVAGYVAQDQSNGAITYVDDSDAKFSGFPTAKVLNAAGYYTPPDSPNAAIALRGATINTTPGADHLAADLSGVFANLDPRAYPLSSYSYMIVPTTEEGTFNASKGAALSTFDFKAVCSGQSEAPVLGYAGLPKNLVLGDLDQIQQIPGADASLTAANCDNPVLSATTDPLDNVPDPPACDHVGQPVCGTPPPPPPDAIDARYAALGGENSFLGAPVGDETDVAAGRVRHYAHGDIYWSAGTGAYEVDGPILKRYLQLGGPATSGFPTADVHPVAGGRAGDFQSVNLYWNSRNRQVHSVRGAIRRLYLRLGEAQSFLGLPASDEHTIAGGRVSDFTGANGRIYWSSATGPHEVHGAVEREYLALGGPRGIAGFPTSNERAVPGSPGARVNVFAKNNLHIFSSAATGAHEVHGAISRTWVNRYGGPTGKLGLPVSDEYAVKGGRASRFQHGIIVWRT